MIQYNDSENTTNIDTDPLFEGPTAAIPDYRLQTTPTISPAIDEGRFQALAPYGIAGYSDLDGYKRVQNRAIDIGCYEHGTDDPTKPDIVLMCWIDESDASYKVDEDLYLDHLEKYKAQLLKVNGLMVKSGVYVPYNDYQRIIPYWYTDDDLPWDTITDFGLYNSTTINPFTQEKIAETAMADYDDLRDGFIPLYLVLVVDDSSTGDFENAINAFKDDVVTEELAENIIVYDVEEQEGGEWKNEQWLNELKLMLNHAVNQY